MKPNNTPESPTVFIRWCMIVIAVWILNAATLIYATWSSARRPLDFGGSLTEAITTTQDEAKQRQYNAVLLRAVDNRVRAVKSLQTRVAILSGGVIATGVFVLFALAHLRRNLRREINIRIDEV